MNASQWEPIADRIASRYPGSAFDGQRRAAYLEGLGELRADDVSRAVDALLTEPRPEPPSVAVIRQAVLRGAVPSPGAEWLAPADGLRRSYLPALVFASSAVAALALLGIAVWWLWSVG